MLLLHNSNMSITAVCLCVRHEIICKKS